MPRNPNRYRAPSKQTVIEELQKLNARLGNELMEVRAQKDEMIDRELKKAELDREEADSAKLQQFCRDIYCAPGNGVGVILSAVWMIDGRMHFLAFQLDGLKQVERIIQHRLQKVPIPGEKK